MSKYVHRVRREAAKHLTILETAGCERVRAQLPYCGYMLVLQGTDDIFFPGIDDVFVGGVQGEDANRVHTLMANIGEEPLPDLDVSMADWLRGRGASAHMLAIADACYANDFGCSLDQLGLTETILENRRWDAGSLTASPSVFSLPLCLSLTPLSLLLPALSLSLSLCVWVCLSPSVPLPFSLPLPLPLYFAVGGVGVLSGQEWRAFKACIPGLTLLPNTAPLALLKKNPATATQSTMADGSWPLAKEEARSCIILLFTSARPQLFSRWLLHT
jgi:hypothetical protein